MPEIKPQNFTMRELTQAANVYRDAATSVPRSGARGPAGRSGRVGGVGSSAESGLRISSLTPAATSRSLLVPVRVIAAHRCHPVATGQPGGRSRPPPP